ncbi:zinc-dependent alcohol dehydrogenase family protein [bacterium]|nr:zinc-dependent alcohol dehydrogenase family protein [bacterium]
MRAMVMHKQREPLVLMDVPRPMPEPGQVLVKVSCCGVCRTDLHVVDGDLTEPKLPLIPGHQVVGVVAELGGGDVYGLSVGAKVGIPWLGGSCGQCAYCQRGEENLCDASRYTGYQLDGGFAEYCAADARFCFPLPAGYPDLQAAPLLCAGLIGYRSYRMACLDDDESGVGAKPCFAHCQGSEPEGRSMASPLPHHGNRVPPFQRLGLFGFGAAAHIVSQVARFQGREVYAFTKPGDASAQVFARELGAVWAGDSFSPAPKELDCAIIFAPAGELVPAALKAVRRGGRVICAGIHMSDIPSFPYSILWGERSIKSVANLTRRDGEEFLALAPEVPVQTTVHPYPLERANEALDDLRAGRFNGQAVIVVDE